MMVLAHAFIYEMALVAYCALPEIYHASDIAYAASASCRSSVQPMFGVDVGPHSTVVVGVGVRERLASECESMDEYAEDQGYTRTT